MIFSVLADVEHFRRAFLFFDTDGSGYIEREELCAALVDESGEVDIEVLNDIINEVDTDMDGCISYEEFVAMMKTGTDWRKASHHYSRERFKSLSLLDEGWFSEGAMKELSGAYDVLCEGPPISR
ncbi:hypothetical protein IFM89_037989 [Coptis chinensis]|uniref:EF-hand domain-containing protein n=1 Tax=Coptis chinensis TaxID=261450 RepID=A0A835LYC6_9MAGN|nr:hypothetical protein IFM89_037989 [Coptis chinensis]